MGCGQSKIHLYPRKNKSKANGKKNGHSENNEADEEEGHNADEHEKDCNNEKEKIENENHMIDNSDTPNGEITVPILRRNGPLLQSQDISSSQQNFFRMLDEKIEQGPDYDSSSETEIALEEARLNALIQHWESASLTASMCSSTNRSLQGTPVRQVNFRPQLRPPFPGSPLSAELQQLQAQHQQLQLLKAQQQQMANSPKRDIRPLLVAQSILQQSYVTPSSTAPATSQMSAAAAQAAAAAAAAAARNMRSLPPQPPTAVLPPMAFYSQPPQSYYGEVLHPIQVPQANPTEPRFPPAISVQRLAPQVQRQIRETQELIKDSCPQLYAAGYGNSSKWQSYHHGAPH